jgi:hypothetical protein
VHKANVIKLRRRAIIKKRAGYRKDIPLFFCMKKLDKQCGEASAVFENEKNRKAGASILFVTDMLNEK